MKEKGIRVIAAAMSLVLMIQLLPLAQAAEAVNNKLNPTDQIVLKTPDDLVNAGNFFFLEQNSFLFTETSREKIYIPVQRTGDLSQEAEITAKAVDITSRYGENYTIEVYKDPVEPTVKHDNYALVDLVQMSDYTEEVETGTDNELGELLYETGGADILDQDDEVVGHITAAPNGETPAAGGAGAETGAPAAESPAAQPGETVSPLDVDYGDSPTAALRQVRNIYTDTVSDRQGMVTPEELMNLGKGAGDAGEAAEPSLDPVVEDYPGREYRLHFDAGEAVKFLVVTPMYSERNDGKSELMVVLMNASEDYQVAPGYFMADVTILDTDEADPITLSMKTAETTAEDGYAYITVTRQGQINEVAGVRLTSWEGSASQGNDYGGVAADMLFPMGITERTIKLPVAQRAEDLDFYVTLSKLDDFPDTVFDIKTVHVTIPAVEIDPELALMDDVQLGEDVNLRDNIYQSHGDWSNRDDGYALHSTTEEDEEQAYGKDSNYYYFKLPHKYVYDGFRTQWHTFRNWADAEFYIGFYQTSWNNSKDVWETDYDTYHTTITPEDGNYSGTDDVYFGQEKSPTGAFYMFRNTGNHWSLFRECHVELDTYSTQMIERKFNFTVEDAETMPLVGGGRLNTGFLVGDTVKRSFSIYPDEDFTLNQTSSSNNVLMTGIQVKNQETGKWKTLCEGSGNAGSVTYTLTKDDIDSLAADGYIKWTKASGNKRSYEGNLTVRPYFEYYDVTVEVKENQYGTLYYYDHLDYVTDNADDPTRYFDFDSDGMHTPKYTASDGATQFNSVTLDSTNGLDYTREKDDDGNEYYRFTATGDNQWPYFDLNYHYNREEISGGKYTWIKFRAKNPGKAEAVEIYGSLDSYSRTTESKTHLYLSDDDEWHTYLYRMPDENIRTRKQADGVTMSSSKWDNSSNIYNLQVRPIWKENGCSEGDEVLIDYIAFFDDRGDADAYRSDENNPADEYKELEPGNTYHFHAGDVLYFKTEISETGETAGMNASGVSYQLYDDKNGTLINDSDSENYINGTLGFELSTLGRDGSTRGYYYTFEPTFTEDDNMVTVVVEEDDLQYFDTSTGLFEDADTYTEGTQHIYIIARDVLTNEVVEIWAATTSEDYVPTWTLSGSSTVYSGNAFYLSTGVSAEDNRVTLSVDRNADDHADYAISGTLYCKMMNLSTNQTTKTTTEVEGAPIMSGIRADQTDENGDFTIPPQKLVGETTLRYVVLFNGDVRIQEVNLPNTGVRTSEIEVLDLETGMMTTTNAIEVTGQYPTVPSYSSNTAHFTGIEVYQDSVVSDVISSIEMTGKKVEITLSYADGNGYLYNGESLEEHVTDVRLYFMDQYGSEIHGEYTISGGGGNINTSSEESGDTGDEEGGDSSESAGQLTMDSEAKTVTLTFPKFTPDSEEYEAGDVLYAQITTDKKLGFSGEDEDSEQTMTYQVVSTGVSVFTDQDYEPETMDISIHDMASYFQVTGSDGTQASFGTFPLMGSISAAITTFGAIRKLTGADDYASRTARQIMNDLDDMADEDDDDDSYDGDYLTDGLTRDEDGNVSDGTGSKSGSSWVFGIMMDVSRNNYGSYRFKFALVISKGYGSYSRSLHPYKSYLETDSLRSFYNKMSAESDSSNEVSNTGLDSIDKSMKKMVRSEWMGAYATFSMYFGIYFDFGVIDVTTRTGDSTSETEHYSFVFMGAGGFVGGKVTVGYSGAIPCWPIIYYNIEGSVNVTLFLGAEADHNKTLEAFENTQDHDVMGEDWSFNCEVKGRVSLSGTLGAGMYKILGVRATIEFGMEFNYSNTMVEWVPSSASPIGLTTDFTVSGTVDLIVISIDLFSFSWALPFNAGWGEYYQEAQRGRKCVSVVEKNIQKEKGTEEVREYLLDLIDEYNALINSGKGTATDIETKWEEIRDYAYDNEVINSTEKTYINTLRCGGLVGNIMSATLEDDSSSFMRVRGHVASDWVADKGVSLMGAFKPVENSTATIVEDAITGASPQLMSIGDGKYLLVFCTDDNSRDEMQASKLVWNIYDANSGRFQFSEPKTVQNDDVTLDVQPFLCDAGGKVLLAWSSIQQDKYEDLLAETRTELEDSLGTDVADEQVQDELVEDPSVLLNLLDIFFVEFDKGKKEFGAIEQLTDDGYEDTNVQLVYDDETGDYLAIYNKTAQDSMQYDSAEEAVVDNLNPYADPEGTYSVMAYMVYNAEAGDRYTDDAENDVETGWVRHHLYEEEQSDSIKAYGVEKYLENYNGQRFLETSFHGLTDPPIYDLTVASGYNGLASYAFTVDRDYDPETTGDRELYIQFYDFGRHKTYVPIQIAGDETVTAVNTGDKTKKDTTYYETTESVEVSRPQLVRSGGSTFLFWCEGTDAIKYINVSQLMKATVADDCYSDYEDATEADIIASTKNVRYAVKEDGTLDEDYTLDVRSVDFGRAHTGDALTAGEYSVITDEKDNLYVLWTDTIQEYVQYEDTDDLLFNKTAQEIYATSYISEEDGGPSWSKPYRMTRDDKYHDSVTVALADDGGLILVYNEYDMLRADTEEEVQQMLLSGQAMYAVDEETGEETIVGSPYYATENELKITRCAAVGSVEVTEFTFSEDVPQPGDELSVKALIENTGLTTAEGAKTEIYVVKDGEIVEGPILTSETSDRIPVNSSKYVGFTWTVPEEGADGYGLMARVYEPGYDDPVETYSKTFEGVADIEATIDKFQQNGDVFDVEYTLTNYGNGPAPEGTTAVMYLNALYGDLEETYGMKDDLLIEADISGLAAGESKTIKRSIELPVSVFRLCGYDAVTVSVEDDDATVYDRTSCYINMDEPMHLSLNDGQAVSLQVGEEKSVPATFESHLFLKYAEALSYEVGDTSVAMVDSEGNVLGVGAGRTTLTATLLTSGRSVTVPVTVTGSGGGGGGGGSAPAANPVNVPAASASAVAHGKVTSSVASAKAGEKVTLTLTPDEGCSVGQVTVTDADGKIIPVTQNPDGTYSFTMPATAVTVNAVFLGEGENMVNVPAPSSVIHGRTTVEPAAAKEGDKVTVTVSPDPGYQTAGVTVKDANGNIIPVTKNADGTYSFIMPATAVNVLPAFTKIGEPADAANCPKDATCPISKFRDASPNTWYHDGVHWALEKGIMKGTSDTTFEPDGSATRAMVVTMLWRMAGGPTSSTTAPFTDVKVGSWYADAVNWAAETGAVKGTSETTFSPDTPVTREQLATILYRYAQAQGKGFTGAWMFPLDFSDAASVSEWADEALHWMTRNGVITGMGDGTLAPQDNATRAQIATMFMRFASLMTTSPQA